MRVRVRPAGEALFRAVVHELSTDTGVVAIGGILDTGESRAEVMSFVSEWLGGLIDYHNTRDADMGGNSIEPPRRDSRVAGAAGVVMSATFDGVKFEMNARSSGTIERWSGVNRRSAHALRSYDLDVFDGDVIISMPHPLGSAPSRTRLPPAGVPGEAPEVTPQVHSLPGT
ncbi:hypothetical protein ACFFQW_03190 [Umezawaea endophytica]|uniref:Uncharacterized protein n=1 Tax=Umezawaea endophytica TaxID=1654476 RepID=A0A9X2VNB9_9PSEU|nr:hypothetical protein [Umezawaea endophytica]MCS7479152.1 hypothetical protein [Umezawaea endophytica]